MRTSTFTLLMAMTVSAWAEEPFEPRINIIEGESTTIEEYRAPGQVERVKVIPEGAPSYYLVDFQGSGAYPKTVGDEQYSLKIPAWMLLTW